MSEFTLVSKEEPNDRPEPRQNAMNPHIEEIAEEQL
jgi:hypothetical protein